MINSRLWRVDAQKGNRDEVRLSPDARGRGSARSDISRKCRTLHLFFVAIKQIIKFLLISGFVIRGHYYARNDSGEVAPSSSPPIISFLICSSVAICFSD